MMHQSHVHSDQLENNCGTALRHPSAPLRKHALRLAEARINASKSVTEAVDALAAIGRRDGGNSWSRMAVLSGGAHRSGALFETLVRDRTFLGNDAATTILREIAQTAGARAHRDEVSGVMESLATPDIVRGLGEGLRKSGASLEDRLNPTAKRLFDDLVRDALVAASDADGTLKERRIAIEILAHSSFEIVGEALHDLLSYRQPQEIQLASIRALAALDHPSVASTLLTRWAGYSPPLRREATEALFARAERLTSFLKAIEKGDVPIVYLDPARRQSLLDHPDATIRERATELFSEHSTSDRAQVLESYMENLKLDGSTASGRAVFEKICSSCHRVDNIGHNVGPSLATSQGHTAESLLTQIIDPNRRVLPNYLNYTLVTKTGRILSGIIAEETQTSVTLRRAQGVAETVLRSSIASLTSSGRSLMPDGLEEEIDPQKMAHLIRFIQSISGPAE